MTTQHLISLECTIPVLRLHQAELPKTETLCAVFRHDLASNVYIAD